MAVEQNILESHEYGPQFDFGIRMQTAVMLTSVTAVDLKYRFDESVKSQKWDGKGKSSSSRRRESRVMRRTGRTSNSQRDEAQHRNWTFYEAIRFRIPNLCLFLR